MTTLTNEEKQHLLRMLGGVANRDLVVLALEEQVLPWMETQGDVSELSALELRSQLKELGLNFLMARTKEQIPGITDEEILRGMSAEQLLPTVVLMGSVVQTVSDFMKLTRTMDELVAQKSQNLDEELRQLTGE